MRIDTDVFTDEERVHAAGGMDRYLERRVREVNAADVEAWRQLSSLEDWEAFKRPRILALEESLGKYPALPERIDFEVTGEIEGDGYVIDKVVFVSREGIEVTANVWRPDLTSNGVGIVLVHSHHNPRTQVELQDMGAMWARVGCTVLVMDQFGYGERREHPEGARHDYWNRYNTGIQLHAIGDSLMGWMVWDTRRGIDLLEQQYGAEKIVVIGSVAGGGDPCAVVAALDERVDVAVPFNFGGPQPETVHPLPDDAELAFNYLGSGSWETTRNLAWSGRDGFLPWVIVGSIAPRKLIYAHEFAWDDENDPVWARLNKIYAWYGEDDGLDWVKGFGGVKLRPPNASHCNNVGMVHRERIHLALERWLGVRGVAEGEERRAESELRTFEPRRHQDTKKGKGKGGGRSYLEVMKGVWEERKGEVGVEEIEAALGPIDVDTGARVVRKGVEEVEGVGVERFVVEMSDGVGVPGVLLTPPRPPDQVRGRLSPEGEGDVTIAVSGFGKRSILGGRGDEIVALLEEGAVCLVDVRGIGELAPDEERTFRSRCAGRAATALMLGESVLGMQLRDLRTVIAHLRSEGYERIVVKGWVEEPRGVEERERGRDYPVDGDDVVARSYVEPVGVVLARLASLDTARPGGEATPASAEAAAGRRDGGGSLVEELLEDHVVRWPMDCVVPGMMGIEDLG